MNKCSFFFLYCLGKYYFVMREGFREPGEAAAAASAAVWTTTATTTPITQEEKQEKFSLNFVVHSFSKFELFVFA